MNTNVSEGVELAVGIIVFFFIGFGVDAWVGTTPLFMIIFTVFAVIGNFVKMYYSYSRAMSHEEKERARLSRVRPS